MQAFVYERDVPVMAAAALLQDVNWPTDAHWAWMLVRHEAQREQERLEHEADDAYWAEQERLDAAEQWDDDVEDVDDVDVDVCQGCGRHYGPHEKMKTWSPTYRGAIMPQLCFRCW